MLQHSRQDSNPRHRTTSTIFLPESVNFNHYYFERSELLIDGDGKKKYAKRSTQKKHAKKRAPSPDWPIISLKTAVRTVPIYSGARDSSGERYSERRPRRSSGVRLLAYTDPSGERQRAPSTSQQWDPPSLHRSFRRATVSNVHAAAVGSV